MGFFVVLAKAVGFLALLILAIRLVSQRQSITLPLLFTGVKLHREILLQLLSIGLH